VRIELDPDAEQELFAAADWYDSREPGLGDELLDEAEHWLEVISVTPTTWPVWHGAQRHRPPVRKCLLSRFGRYAIAYQAFPDRVRVIAFVHESRKPFYWSGRIRKA